ncbi:MAG: hypothetical protein A2166_06085 [Omnitrophica WOR_2 bacterium RBG_13_41_10]|nr:MAG: hypothetical protein A2166_06085 [Omnitrophica WOR_2 bacterium RBG_13_41_10]
MSKREKIIKRTIFMAMLVLTAISSAYAYDDGDFQIWNTDVEEFKVNKDSKIAFEEEFRWGNNASEFYYQHYDIGFFHNLKKWLNIGGGYRQVYELKKGKFKLENEPYVTMTLLWDLKGFKFDDRSRIEYRYFDYQDDSWRYRNKIAVKLPWKFTKLEIQPYLSDEVFIGFSTISEFNQNRFSSGLSMNLTKKLKAEIYYMLQSTKSSGKWVDANVFGTKMKITF